jgi:hypothetical protein
MALCLLFVLAGCSAFSGPAAEDTPGIADDQLLDSEALLNAHVEALTETGYRHEVRLNQTQVVDGEAAESTRRQRTSVAPGGEAYLFELINQAEVSSRFVVWGNETVQYQRIEAGGSDPQYRRSEPTSEAQLAGARLLEAHLTAPFEVVEVTERDDAPPLVTLEATSNPTAAGAFPSQATNVENYAARLVVDTDGRIYSFRATAEYALDGEAAEYELAFELTDIGDPGVERPDWVEALES